MHTLRHPSLLAFAGPGVVLLFAFVVAWMGMVRKGNTFWGRLTGQQTTVGNS